MFYPTSQAQSWVVPAVRCSCPVSHETTPLNSCWKACCHQPRARKTEYCPEGAFPTIAFSLSRAPDSGWRTKVLTSIQGIHQPLEDGVIALKKKKQKKLFTLFCRTTKRPQTFYDGSHACARGVCHIPMAEPFCPKTREVRSLSGRCTEISCGGLGWHLELYWLAKQVIPFPPLKLASYARFLEDFPLVSTASTTVTQSCDLPFL